MSEQTTSDPTIVTDEDAEETESETGDDQDEPADDADSRGAFDHF